MNILQKITTGTGSLLALLPAVTGHGGSEQAYGSGMMGGAGMHGSGHMAGYSMWGMGWFGALFSVTIWILAVFSILYLYNNMTTQHSEEEQ